VEGWTCHELPTGHDCYVELPEVVTGVILAAGSDGRI
jgi:hypothetical protein